MKEQEYELTDILLFEYFNPAYSGSIGRQRADGWWEFRRGKEFEFALSPDRFKEVLKQGIFKKLTK